METNPDLRRTSPTGLRLIAVALLLPLLLHLCVLRIQAQATWSYDALLTTSAIEDINFGSSLGVSPNGIWLVIGARADEVNDLGAAGSLSMYKRGSSEWELVTTLTAATPVVSTYFGYSVAITNDRVIGGAPYADSSAGRLTPFLLSGSTWTRQTELVGPAGSQLGGSLTTDGAFLVAGGKGYSDFQGIVIVYTLDGSGAWASPITLSGATTSNAYMGLSVAIGSSLIAAGAQRENNFQGAAYVWSMPSGTVASSATRLTSSTALVEITYFGIAVAILSPTAVVVGCNTISSVIYIFTFASGAWSQSPTVAAPNGEFSFGNRLSYGQYGLLVGCSGKTLLYSVTGDSISSSYIDLVPTGVHVTGYYGLTKVVLSGTYAIISDIDSDSSTPVQNVFSFKGIAPPTQSRSLSPVVESVVPNKKSKSKALGYKVAFWNDNAIISVPFCFDTSKSCDGGYILLFQKDSVSNKWLFNTKVRNPFRNRDNKFGYNIYVRDNYLFVSVPDSNYVDKNAGIIVVYKWNPATNTYEKDSIIRYRKTDKVYALGAAISNFGAITAIGMPDYDKSDVLTNAGGVHAYKKKDTGKWRERKTITAPTPQADEHFGQSVSLQSETRIAISNKPTDASLQAVYIFDFIEDAWACVKTLPDATKAGFGWNIKFFDDLLYISAASGAGSITVYEADADEKYVVSYTFQPKAAVTDERFGFSFATDSTRFVVGTQPCDNGAVCGTKGSVYTFTKDSSNQWAGQYCYALGAADGSDGFGFDVAISGDTVLVSAPFKAVNTRDGVAYFITK